MQLSFIGALCFVLAEVLWIDVWQTHFAKVSFTDSDITNLHLGLQFVLLFVALHAITKYFFEILQAKNDALAALKTELEALKKDNKPC